MPKNSIADRGKYAEAEVTKFLKSRNTEHWAFDWARLPDARAAGGRLAAQVADFEIFMPGSHGVIEVKEIAHDFRIPTSKIAQIPRLRKRRNAGGEIIILIYHTTTKLWRIPPSHFFLESEPVPSFDVSDWPTFCTCADALNSQEFFQ